MDLEREFVNGWKRVNRQKEPGALARLGTERMLDKLCDEQPNTVRESVEELARMRAAWQEISYRKALSQIVEAARKHGSPIDA
jgi:hypothetical protein